MTMATGGGQLVLAGDGAGGQVGAGGQNGGENGAAAGGGRTDRMYITDVTVRTPMFNSPREVKGIDVSATKMTLWNPTFQRH